MKPLVCFVLLALTSIGCGGDDSLSDKLDDQQAVARELAEKLCNCLPGEVAQTCIDSFDELYTPAERSCLLEVLEMDEEASRASLDCIQNLSNNYLDCLDEEFDCDLTGETLSCAPDDDDWKDCELPPDMEAAADACTGDDENDDDDDGSFAARALSTLTRIRLLPLR